jgi:hypothetical protein
MKSSKYKSMKLGLNRREFFKIGGATAGVAAMMGLKLGNPDVFAKAVKDDQNNDKIKTNIEDALKAPKTEYSLPGLFPGKVVKIENKKILEDDKISKKELTTTFENGIQKLTGKNIKESYNLFFKPDDIIGIKVNPVGPGLISTRVELVEVIVDWLKNSGMNPNNIVIWDRFDYMLKDAGFTNERFPGVQIEGLQTMDDDAAMGKIEDNSKWLDANGKHLSQDNFDMENYYWADVDAPTDNPYLNQNVFNNKYSYFGKLVTQKLTKIINVPVFKNTGNGISMATKNLGYGAICNTGRLHRPLFFDVCTEVLAFSALRDKLVLNITDAIKGQYDGGPEPNARFIYDYNTLFFATDPFALDMVCHNIIFEKRKSMNVKVNDHPMYTNYLKYAETLGLGIVDPDKIKILS